MNPVVFHLVSGDAYFSGSLLIMIAISLSNLTRERWRRVGRLVFVFGWLLILLTAVPSRPTEIGILVVAFVLSSVAVFAAKKTDSRNQKLREVEQSSGRTNTQKIIKLVALLAIGFMILSELNWRRRPSFNKHVPRTLIVFADSVTAGIGENEAVTWPNLLAEKQSLQVFDYSRMGATVGSQLKWLQKRQLPDGLILIELGGNDMLGSTTVAEFESVLDQFLKQLSQTGQPIVMFELPLPPTFNRFGILQRRLAKKHGVQLLSKRLFTQILAANGATLDSIHLSQTGHEVMEKAVWDQIQTAFEP